MDAALSNLFQMMGSNATESEVLVGILVGILEGILEGISEGSLSKLAIVGRVLHNVHIE